MTSEHSDREKPSNPITKSTNVEAVHLSRALQESVRTALALVLGPETEYPVRVRATRRLIRQGPSILPLVLTTLSSYPEIASPPWPWWPPQYEHCSRLLIHFSQKAQTSLEELLLHPIIFPPTGPVLWTSVMEAAGLLSQFDHEALLCRGLEVPWMCVRYSAAMALAARAVHVSLHPSTINILRKHYHPQEEFPVRLAASYALLCSGENVGIEALIQLLDVLAPEEARKAAAFVLATELPIHLSVTQREHLTQRLLTALYDPNTEVAIHAAHALSGIAQPSVLPSLCEMLELAEPEIQIIALMVLEEMTHRSTIRRVIQHLALPARIVPLLKSVQPEVRRQASYTLAACGGEYVTAVLGTIIHTPDHPGFIQAVEGLRLLYGVLRAPLRTHVVRWLLQVLQQSQEESQVTALDSLVYLLWQAHIRGQKQVCLAMSQEIVQDGTVLHQLHNTSSWVRQRTIELLGMLYHQHALLANARLLQLLHTDSDAGVRACIAYVYGKTGTYRAIPDLIHTLLDPDEHVAQTALNALSYLTSPDDPIVLYVIKELTYISNTSSPQTQALAMSAGMLLKKWRGKKKLQSAH